MPPRHVQAAMYSWGTPEYMLVSSDLVIQALRLSPTSNGWRLEIAETISTDMRAKGHRAARRIFNI